MIKKFLMTFLTFVLIIAFALADVNALSSLNITVVGQQHYQEAYEVLDIVNEERAKENLEPLVMDKDLLDAAMLRAAETSLYFDHTRPDGSSCFTVCSKMNGENIAAGSSTAAGTMNQWMNSSGHRDNILNSSYQSIGIGCFQIGSVYYWVQCFGRDSATTTNQKNSSVNFRKSIAINKDLVEIYAYSVGDTTYGDYYLVGEKGYLNYGILNQGWPMVYALGVSDDYTFTSSNSSIVSINNKGEFTALNEGSATISISLKEDPTISYSEVITVKREDLSDERYTYIYNLEDSYQYNGNKICPKVDVYYTLSRLLKEGKDYTISYQNNINAGEATVIIKGIGKYKGSLKKTFKINKLTYKPTIKGYNGTYDEKAHTIALSGVKSGSTIKYSTDNKTWSTKKPTRTNAGTTTVYYQITNPNYNTVTGSQKITINKLTYKPTIKGYNGTYDGKSHTITLSGVKTGSTIKYRTSTSAAWSTKKPTRTNAGTTTVYYQITNPNYNTITGSQKITIAKRNISTLTYSKIANQNYTGKQIKPSITVQYGKSTLKNGTDYTVAYGTNKALGTGTVKITGKGNYTGTKTISFKIVKNVSQLSYSKISNKTYTGKQIKPSITVKDGKTTLKNGTHYTVSYGTNKATGKATVKITGKGNYTGTITKTFYIVPKTPGSVKVTAGKKSVKISYKKSTGASGYQIAYQKKGASKWTYVNVSNKTTSKTLTKLTSQKNYNVKVRAYKTVGKTKYYGSYSKAKTIKVK